ncbi:MAG: DUF3098 domain-containing protein [Pseudoflavonifractor sp.]|nr:DUF3098 domain-containing protein [Alloprevotella sp.]MCM1115986.1 DUF3098 domain-containing protein [Pseudoflavonifractor sp.]
MPIATDKASPVSIKALLPLTRLNFILMGAAALVIIIGFLLMTGAPSSADAFNPDIFSWRRIVAGPTISFLGYIFMGVAIMWPSRRKSAIKDAPASDQPTSTL